MIGVQFTQVGGAAKDIGTVGTCDATMAGFDEDGNYPTEMRVWNGLGYDYYGWAGSSGTDVADEPSLDNQWLDFNTMEPGVDPMATGAGFWIKTDSSGTLTISGEVPSGATVQVPLVAGYNIVANPYPAAVEIGQFGILDASFAGFDEDGNYPTEMRVWNGLGYDYYGWAGSSGTDVADEPSLDNQWLDFNTMEPSTQKLPYGTAVWIKAEKAGTITFSAPSAN